MGMAVTNKVGIGNAGLLAPQKVNSFGGVPAPGQTLGSFF